jgi:hypothetical protein
MSIEKAGCSVSFYDPATGLFTGRRYSGPSKYLDINTPSGMSHIAGTYDHLSQRVESGEVVDYRPTAPDEDHEWNEEIRRWRVKPEIAEQRQRRKSALKQIDELERRQLRPARELAIDPSNEESARRLREIEGQIAMIRDAL